MRGLRFAELACARVLHDLSGVAGTLSNTIELLAEESGGSEGTQLAEEAAAMLNLRLRLLRAAWVGDGEARGADALAELAAAVPGAPRVRRGVLGPAPDALGPEVGRVVLALVLAGSESLPRGGTVILSGDAAGLTARLDGSRAAWPNWLADAAADEPALPDSSRTVAGPMLVLAAAAAGMVLRRGDTGDQGEFTVLAARRT